MYELRRVDENDSQLLINYKLSTIFEYADDISKEETEQIKEYVNNSVFKLLNEYRIVVVDGRDIGCLLVTEYEDGFLLDEIYLEEDYRGQGIGSLLIKSVINKHGVVYLWVYKKNEKAIKLYEKLGFRKEKETERRYFMKREKKKI